MLSNDGLSLIASRVNDISNQKTPESKTEVLKVLRLMSLYHTFSLKFHIDEKPLYDLNQDTTLFKWLPKQGLFTGIVSRHL